MGNPQADKQIQLFSILPILFAFEAMSEEAKADLRRKKVEDPRDVVWLAQENQEMQKQLVAIMAAWTKQKKLQQIRGLLTGEELKTVASFEYADLEAFLKENGISIKVPPWDNDGSTMGFAAMLKLMLKWIQHREYNYPDSDYNVAVEFTRGDKTHTQMASMFRLMTGVKFYEGENGFVPLVPTEDPNTYTLYSPAAQMLSDFALDEESRRVLRMVESAKGPLKTTPFPSGILLPNWEYEGEVEAIAKLQGMRSKPNELGDFWRLVFAKMWGKGSFGPLGFLMKVAFVGKAVLESVRHEKEIPSGTLILNYDHVITTVRINRAGDKEEKEVLSSVYVPAEKFSREEVDVEFV